MLSNYPEACTAFSLACASGRTGRPYHGHATGAWRVILLGMDDSLQLGRHAEVPLAEITIRASRSSGPGGQHANVTASRIEASFDVRASAALTDEQKQRIISRLGPRVVAVAQDARSQRRNRELALERLRARIEQALQVRRARRPTKPSRAAKARRLDAKRRAGERKHGRGRISSEDD